MDLKNLTNEELQAHKVAVLTEIERRQFMEDALDQARDLGTKYEQNGGDPAVLAGAIIGGE